MSKKEGNDIYVDTIDMKKVLHDVYEDGPQFKTGKHMTEKDRPRDKNYKKLKKIITIKDILMQRDGMFEIEVEEFIKDVQAGLDIMISNHNSIVDMEIYVREELGLEPDYIIELTDGMI